MEINVKGKRLMENEFEQDLDRGKKVEEQIFNKLKKKHPDVIWVQGEYSGYDILLPEERIEVKYDPEALTTGNICIEIGRQNGTPSGIHKTRSDYYYIYTGMEIFKVKTAWLRSLIAKNNYKETFGKDKDGSKLVLIPIDAFRRYDENSSSR